MATTTDTLIFELKVKDDASKVFDAWEKRLNNLEREARQTFGEIERMMSGAFSGNIGKSLDNAFSGLDRIPSRAKRSFDGMATSALGAFGVIASAATKAFGVVWNGLEKITDIAADFARDSVAAFQDYESALALVSKTTGFTGEELNELGDQARDLAKPLGDLTAIDLLQVAEQAGQLGIVAGKSFSEAKDIIADFSVDIGKGSIAMDSFGGNTEKLASSVAKVENIFGLTTAETGNLLSMWSKMSTSTAANELSISNFMQQMVRGQATLKLTAAEAGALAGVFANSGIQMSSGARLLSSASANIAKGGKFVAAATALIRNELDGGAQSIQQLENITGRSASSFANAGEMLQYAFGKNALATMQVLSSAFVDTSSQTQNIEAAVRASEFAVEAFGKQGIPVITAIGESTNKAAEDTKSWAFIIGQSEAAFANASEHLSAYERAVAKSGQAQKELGSVMNDIMITVGGPLSEAFARFLNENLIPLASEFGSWLRDSALMQNLIPSMLDRMNTAFNTAFESAKAFVQGIDWNQFFERVEMGFNSLMEAIESINWEQVFSSISKYLQEIGQILSNVDWGQAFKTLGTVAKETLTFITGTLPKILSLVTDIVNLFSKMEGVIKPLFGAIKIGFSEMVRQVKAPFDVLNGLGELVGSLAEKFKSFFSEITSGSKVIEKLKGIGEAVKGIIPAIKGAAKEMYGNSFLPDTVEWSEKAGVSMGNVTQQVKQMERELKTASDTAENMKQVDRGKAISDGFFDAAESNKSGIKKIGKNIWSNIPRETGSPDKSGRGSVDIQGKDFGIHLDDTRDKLQEVAETSKTVSSSINDDWWKGTKKVKEETDKATQDIEKISGTLPIMATGTNRVASGFSRMASEANRVIDTTMQFPRTLESIAAEQKTYIDQAMQQNATVLQQIAKQRNGIDTLRQRDMLSASALASPLGNAQFVKPLTRPTQQTAQSPTPQSTSGGLGRATQSRGGGLGGGGASRQVTNINFVGQNIVDESSKNRYARQVTKIQSMQKTQVIRG